MCLAPGDERGVALPVALLALVAVSILVTSLLLSSATEVSLSAAHQDATRGLFTAEGAIEAYVARHSNELDSKLSAPFFYTPPEGSSRDEVQLSVSVLGSVPSAVTGQSNTTYAIAAAPRRGGRQVVAMIDKVWHPFRVLIDAGLVSGDNVVVTGGAKLSDGSDLTPTDKAYCAENDDGKAVQTTMNADTAKVQGSGQIIGANDKIDVAAGNLVESLFGRTLEEMIESADIKLTGRTYPSHTENTVTYHTVGKVTSLTQVGRPDMQLDSLNWGCPADIFYDCESDSDLTRMPVIAIDASKPGECRIVKKVRQCDPDKWGNVLVDMSHGQGILIVYNGSFKVAGQFAFKGIILVQGSFRIEGKGSADPQNSPKIEGAVIGLGFNQDGKQSTVDDTYAKGGATVRYNRCAINLVTQQITKDMPPIQRMGGRTFGWFEVVR